MVAHHSGPPSSPACPGPTSIRAARFALWARGAQGRANGRNLPTALRGGGAAYGGRIRDAGGRDGCQVNPCTVSSEIKWPSSASTSRTQMASV
jgi:hypothetical protein